jgi:transposase
MMGVNDTQKGMFHTVQICELVPEDHPLRKIRPLIDTERIRQLCAPFYCEDNGRPSIPPEQLFMALLGGYLLGVRSDRKLIMELQCNMAFRWFVGLDIDSTIWDASTFSKNREGRFDESGVLETLFDDTVKVAMKKGLVSSHWSVDGTAVRADASYKSFAPIEVYQSTKEYKKTIRGSSKPNEEPVKIKKDDDPGNPTVDWSGKTRSNKTHRSTTDPDCRLATKSSKETAIPAYTVNAVMENRNRIIVGIGVESPQGPTAETRGVLKLLTRAKKRLKLKPKSIGADKGFFEKKFIRSLFKRKIEPHIAAKTIGSDKEHARVRMRQRGIFYQMSQRARKKIEELWGEAKEEHGFRRFFRRLLENVQQEALMIGWLLNLKRLSALPAFGSG